VDVVKVMASGGMLTAGSDPFGVQLPDEDLRLLVDEAHAAGLPVVAHAHSLAAAWQSLRAGVDGIEHLTCLSEQGMQPPASLLAELAERGVVVDLTMGNDPAVVAATPPPPAIAAALDRIGVRYDRMREERLRTVEAVRRHGVVQVAGVDAGAAPPKAHGNAWRVVVDLVEGGYPLADALAAATSVAARACGLAGVTGALRPRLDADLLIVPGDLRRDLSALAGPTAVWIRGLPVRLRPAERQSASGASGASSA
jgi:imidazolonepropionase-like amidohydrolase